MTLETAFVSDMNSGGAPRGTYLDLKARHRFVKPADGHDCRLACMTCLEAYDVWRQQRFRAETIAAQLVHYGDDGFEKSAAPWPKGIAWLCDVQIGNFCLAGEMTDDDLNYDLAKLSGDGEPLPTKVPTLSGLEPMPLMPMSSTVIVRAVYNGDIDPHFVNQVVGKRRIGMRFVISGVMLSPLFPNLAPTEGSTHV